MEEIMRLAQVEMNRKYLLSEMAKSQFIRDRIAGRKIDELDPDEMVEIILSYRRQFTDDELKSREAGAFKQIQKKSVEESIRELRRVRIM